VAAGLEAGIDVRRRQAAEAARVEVLQFAFGREWARPVEIEFDLRDATFSLLAEASLAGQRLRLPRLQLAAGTARLLAQGELDLNGPRPFTAEGELQHFDPSRFGRLPPAHINARLKASGHLAPQPVVDAFNEVIKANPGMKVLDAKHGNWNRDDAFKVMQDYLTRFKKIDAVWASDDDMAVGVQKAIEQAKRTDIKLVIGGAGAKGYVKKVMDGDPIVKANVTYSPSMIADAMKLTADARVKGADMPATTIIPSVLITKDNAAQYYFPDSPF
jgi:hypothetical protein